MTQTAEKRKYESPRQRERQATILEAARRMLEMEGYAGVTMRALAREAGVAQATLYNIYGSKDDLILCAVEDLLLGVEADVTAAESTSGIESILTRARVNGLQIQKTPKYADAMARSLAGVQAGDPLVSLLYTRAVPFLEEHLQIALEQGDLLPRVDVRLTAQHMVGQHWGVTWLWVLGVIALEDIVVERVRTDITALIAVTRGPARQNLERQLADLPLPSSSAALPTAP